MGLLRKTKNILLLTFAAQAAAGLSHVSAQAVDAELAGNYIKALHACMREHADSNAVEDPKVYAYSQELQEQLRRAAIDSLVAGNKEDFSQEIALIHAFASAARDTTLAKQTRAIIDAIQVVDWQRQLYLADVIVQGVLKLSKEELQEITQRSEVHDKPYEVEIKYQDTTYRVYSSPNGSGSSFVQRKGSEIHSIPKTYVLDAVASQTPNLTQEERAKLIDRIIRDFEEHGIQVE